MAPRKVLLEGTGAGPASDEGAPSACTTHQGEIPLQEAPGAAGDVPPEAPEAWPLDPSSEHDEDTSVTRLVEHPVYFVSTVLRDARERYPIQQKLLLVLPVASQ